MKNARRFDVVEPAAIAFAAALLGLLAGQYRVETHLRPYMADTKSGAAGRELEDPEHVYGPARTSEPPEEWMVRDFFQTERGGVFVDVGANHYQQPSNTY